MSNLSIKCLKSEKIQSNNCHAQFLIDNLKHGQGITVGNQLRRVLLNDLGGVAISAVRIAGITNEFSTLPGVREDILEILLNLKGIVFKTKTKAAQAGRLVVYGPKVITADLIEVPHELEIVNPNHYIATVNTSNIIEIEFKFEYGTGYKLTKQTFVSEDEEYLQLDSVFMPVQKVDFKIENIYDANDNVSERLLLDVWTNGSILPIEAIETASKIIINLFSSLISNQDNNIKITESDHKETSLNVEPYNNIAIEELQLSVRAYNCLKRAQINTVGDLLQYSPEKLQGLKNFGHKSADEVFSTLKNKLGIILK